MKSRLITAGLALSASALLVTASRAEIPVVAFPQAAELSGTTTVLAKHTHRREVVARIGAPDARLSPDVWVYWNFETAQPNRAVGLDTLLITFRDDRVLQM